MFGKTLPSGNQTYHNLWSEMISYLKLSHVITSHVKLSDLKLKFSEHQFFIFWKNAFLSLSTFVIKKKIVLFKKTNEQKFFF